MVPFTNKPRRQTLVLSHGDLHSLDTFDHKSESYRFVAGIHVDRFDVSSDLAGEFSADAESSQGFDMPPPAERHSDDGRTGLAERRNDAVDDAAAHDGIHEQEYVSPAMARLDVTI